MKSTCYYCGAPATSREHVPPRIFLKHVPDIAHHQLLTVPACTRHNEAKANLDQAAYNAFALPLYHMLDTSWDRMPADVGDALRKKHSTFAHQKHLTAAVPLVGPELDDTPINLTHSLIDWSAWIRMLTAGLMYVICGRERLAIDWDSTVVKHWNYFSGAKRATVTTDMMVAALAENTALYTEVAPTVWHEAVAFGHQTLPAAHYTYRIGKTGAVWVVEHVFFGQYRVWCCMVLTAAQERMVIRGIV